MGDEVLRAHRTPDWSYRSELFRQIGETTEGDGGSII